MKTFEGYATLPPKAYERKVEHGYTPTEQFWNTHQRIHKEAKILQRCLDGHSRSSMMEYMALMLRYGLLTPSDLDGFSEPLQQALKTLSAL